MAHPTQRFLLWSLDMTLDPRLLEILVCPVTKGPLTYDRAAAELISPKARLAYPIRDGIPIMLPDEARPLDVPDTVT
jgi:uncharacterized protein YbaR (Trm112 family)